jgi:Domain of unknown function (DUF4397)
MKHKNKIYSILALFATFLTMSACGDESNSYGIYSPATGGRVKFIHSAPDVAGIDIYVNDKKFSGVNTAVGATPALLTFGNAYPSTAEYATIPVGKAKIGVVVPSLNNAIGIAADLTVEEGKYYSVFATGISPSYSPLVLEDKLPTTSGKNIYVRVINLIPNSTTAEFTVNGITIATGVGYKNTDNNFVTVPIDAFTSGSISVPFSAKVLGGIATITTSTSIAGTTPGRIFTFIVRGVLTTDAKNPTKYTPILTVYLNK